MPIGFYREYNERGEIVKETNKDTLPFTAQDFIDVAKTRYGIDLTKKRKGLTIGGLKDDDGSEYYYMRYPVDVDQSNKFHIIKISTITGETVFETIKAVDIE